MTNSGSMLPMLLRRCGFDPATSSAPFVATLVDVTGLVLYFNVVDPERRPQGNGTFLVCESAKIYFDALCIKRLICEPYAFNVAPNRTLQAAGFKYVKTHETVPGPFNFHQPVTRWMLEKH